MGLVALLFEKDVKRIVNQAERSAGRVIRDAERAAKGIVDDAQNTAARTVADAERRLIRSYTIAFCLVVGAGLVHFLLVRSQVRALNAAGDAHEQHAVDEFTTHEHDRHRTRATGFREER